MSRGPGKLQRAIVDLLGGKRPLAQFGSSGPKSAVLTTSELLEELVAAEVLPDVNDAREFQLASVRRACAGLVERGVLEGEYATDAITMRLTIEWRVKPAATGTDGQPPAG